LRRKSQITRSTERLPQPGEDREVGVKLHASESTAPERRESPAVLQVSEGSLDGSAGRQRNDPDDA
jgi:hypothetical protein